MNEQQQAELETALSVIQDILAEMSENKDKKTDGVYFGWLCGIYESLEALLDIIEDEKNVGNSNI